MTTHTDSLQIDNSDCNEQKMQCFLRWMEAQGATFPSMTLRVEQGTRQVQAARSLVKEELVLHVPRKLFITPEVARQSPTGRLIAKYSDVHEDNDYMAAFLLQNLLEGGFWKSYIDVLPKDYSENVLFMPEPLLDHLKGSYIEEVIRDRAQRNLRMYDSLPASLKVNGFTREAFTWAKCAVVTRVYSMVLDGKKTSAMVPLADMFNHASDYGVRWFGHADGGFIAVARQPIAPGSPMFESYGSKCNAMLFNVYGFCLDHNPHNKAELRLQALSADHPFFQQAQNLGTKKGGMRAFRVRRTYDDDARALFSYLRLACCDEPHGSVEMTGAGHLPPFSRRNEAAALTALAAACEERLRQFPTSMEEDEALLKAPGLQRKVRNMVMVRRDEKVVLKHYLDMVKMTLPLLLAPSCDFRRLWAPDHPYVDYIDELARIFHQNAE